MIGLCVFESNEDEGFERLQHLLTFLHALVMMMPFQ